MKYFFSLLLLVATSVAAIAQAESAPSSSILYKVTGKALKKPSYLFGTIHIVCEKDLSFAEKIGSYISQTEQMMLETDLDDPEVTRKVAEAALPKGDKTLKDHLTAEEFKKLDDLYKSYLGFSVELLQGVNPTIVSTYFFLSPKVIGCPKAARLDQDLAEVAKVRKNEVIGLESVADQLALIDATPITAQVKGLRQLIDDPDKYIRDFQNMYRLYLSQDADSLYSIITSEMALSGTSKDVYLDKRNAKWIPLIEKQIVAKPTFIAFGAGHLGGKSGVVALLRSKGYKLTPIKL